MADHMTTVDDVIRECGDTIDDVAHEVILLRDRIRELEAQQALPPEREKFVRVSDELVAELKAAPSKPVTVAIVEDGNELHMTFTESQQAASVEPVNQCDGCRAGMPLRDGVHQHNGRAFMGCTADRYTPSGEPVPAFGDDGEPIQHQGPMIPSAAGVTEADLLPLARLGAWTLEHIRGHAAGDVEAWAVQDQAVQLGVIGPVPAPKPCGECCVCEEMDAETCYRDTDATKRARAFLTAALTAASEGASA